MKDPACTAPKEGAESGEQPEERPNRLGMKTGSERPSVKPKRQRGRNGKEEEKDRTDKATRAPYTLYCSCQPTQLQQQQQPQSQQQGLAFIVPTTHVAIQTVCSVSTLLKTHDGYPLQ